MKLRFVTFDKEGTVVEIIETPSVDFNNNLKRIVSGLALALSAVDAHHVRVEKIREETDAPSS